MKVAMPSPRNTNFAKMFMPARGPVAAYDALPDDAYAQVREFLRAKGLSPEAVDEFVALARKPSGNAVARDQSAEEELRKRKISEALSRLQKFAQEKLSPDDLEPFHRLCNELLGAGPVGEDDPSGGSEGTPLDQVMRASSKDDDPAMDGAFETRFPGAAKIGQEYFRRT